MPVKILLPMAPLPVWPLAGIGDGFCMPPVKIDFQVTSKWHFYFSYYYCNDWRNHCSFPISFLGNLAFYSNPPFHQRKKDMPGEVFFGYHFVFSPALLLAIIYWLLLHLIFWQVLPWANQGLSISAFY